MPDFNTDRFVARLNELDARAMGQPTRYAEIFQTLIRNNVVDSTIAVQAIEDVAVRYREARSAGSQIGGGGMRSLMTPAERGQIIKGVRELVPELSKQQLQEVAAVFDGNADEIYRQGWKANANGTIQKPSKTDARAAEIAKPTAMGGAASSEAGHATGSVTEAAGRVGRTALRAIGPIAAVQDVVGYAANQKEAEAKLTGLIGKDGVLKLSKEAVTEYGEIVAKLKIEQGVTFGLSEAIGFSSFMDWAKKNQLPLEAVEKLNPTSKTKAQIEEALNLRGGQMAQAGTAEVVLAQAPDVRQQDGRNIG